MHPDGAFPALAGVSSSLSNYLKWATKIRRPFSMACPCGKIQDVVYWIRFEFYGVGRKYG